MDGMPFMPEMLQYAGQRFQVYKSAHKTCDTVKEYAIRRVESAVHLNGLRCDGQAHGGCQAGCLLFWKEAWLKPVAGIVAGAEERVEGERDPQFEGRRAGLYAATRGKGDGADTRERYRCQATDLLKFTKEVRRRDRWNPLFYVKDLTSHNVTIGQFVRYGLMAALNALSRRVIARRYPLLCGTAGKHTPAEETNLQAGELVRVKSKAEIMRTLNPDLRNRGLSFDVEMAPHCGLERRVLRRVEKIVDEKTGMMMQFPNACIVLEDVVCSGNLSMNRMFCPRAIYPYWREIWLRRIDEAGRTRGRE